MRKYKLMLLKIEKNGILKIKDNSAVGQYDSY